MALAGWTVALYGGGAPVTMTAQAMSSVTATVFRITDAARRIIDPATPPTVYENGTPTGQVIVIDYLAGTVTFPAPPTAPVTITGKFIPQARFGCAREFELVEERVSLDTTCFKLAGETDAGVRKKQLGLFDANGSLGHIEPLVDVFDMSGTGAGANATPIEALLRNALDYTILEIQIGTSRVWRGFVIFTSGSTSVSVEDLVTESFNWELASVAGAGYFTEFDYVA